MNFENQKASPKGTLVAARARLRASLGGLGLTSAVLTSKPAFLGSLCLVSTWSLPHWGLPH